MAGAKKLIASVAMLILGGVLALGLQRSFMMLIRPMLIGKIWGKCVDLYQDSVAVHAYSIPGLYKGFSPPRTEHLVVAGGIHHGMRETEVWMVTFAPDAATQVHKHDMEEVIIVTKGHLSVRYKDPHGQVQSLTVPHNSSIVVLPNAIHQLINLQDDEDASFITVHSRAPVYQCNYLSFNAPACITGQQPWSACPPKNVGLAKEHPLNKNKSDAWRADQVVADPAPPEFTTHKEHGLTKDKTQQKAGEQIVDL